MASTMAKVCQIIGVMVAVCILTVSAAGCTDNAGCSNGKICYKYSDCNEGSCQCAPNWRTDDSGNCVEGTTLLGEGDTCSMDSKSDLCDEYDHLSCTGCPEDANDRKCRSGSAAIRIGILAAILPIVIGVVL